MPEIMKKETMMLLVKSPTMATSYCQINNFGILANKLKTYLIKNKKKMDEN